MSSEPDFQLEHFASCGDLPACVCETFPMLETDAQHCRFILAVRAGQYIGAAKLYDAPENLHMEYLVVAPEYRHKGIATALLDEIFRQAKSANKEVTTNGFSTDGRQYLRHIMDKLGEANGVSTAVIGIC